MIESMLEGVAVINEAGVIEITNPAFDALFGYRRGELIGREMASLAGWPFEQRERWLLAPSGPDDSMRVEFEGRRADGDQLRGARHAVADSKSPAATRACSCCRT